MAITAGLGVACCSHEPSEMSFDGDPIGGMEMYNVGDFDGDGLDDVTFTNTDAKYSAEEAQIAFANPDGSWDFQTLARGFNLRADIDFDGRTDLTGWSEDDFDAPPPVPGRRFIVGRGNPERDVTDGAFQEMAAGVLPHESSEFQILAAGPLDEYPGDDLLCVFDFVEGNDGYEVFVLSTQGGTMFSHYEAWDGFYDAMYSVDVADVDGDGALDVIATFLQTDPPASETSTASTWWAPNDGVHIYKGSGNGDFQFVGRVGDGWLHPLGKTADFDHRPGVDLAVLQIDGGNQVGYAKEGAVLLLQHEGDPGDWAFDTFATVPGGVHLVAGQFYGDDRIDLIVQQRPDENTFDGVLLRVEGGAVEQVPIGTGGAFSAGDINGDGWDDLLLGYEIDDSGEYGTGSPSGIYVRLNDGDGNFGEEILQPKG